MTRFASHVAAGLDPVRLAKQVGMTADEWQADALRSDDERLLLNIHRQGGKSTTIAVKSLHRALYWPGSLVLIVSPTQRQSTELFRKILTFYRAIGRPVNAEAENQLSLTLENGSRIIALPSSEGGIRGYSVDLLIIDEAARVPNELWGAVSPMLAVTHGRVVAMSTPFGKRGWWYDATKSSRWRTVTVKATECPRISPEYLAAERDSAGDFWFRQEFMCEFLDPTGQMFSTADIARIFEPGRLGAFPEMAPFGSAIPATAVEEVEAPAHPEIAMRQRRRALSRGMNALTTAARRLNCSHFWGPEVGGHKCCTKCGEDQQP